MTKQASAWMMMAVLAWSGSALAESQKIEGPNYRVTAEAAACKAGAECSATVRLDVTGAGYHVNKDYPSKIKVADGEAVKFAKADFGKASGDLVNKSENEAVITLKFTAAKAGKAEVAGVFKFAVCSDKDCQTASENIKVAVVVK